MGRRGKKLLLVPGTCAEGQARTECRGRLKIRACSCEISVSLSLLENIAYLKVSASQVEGLAWAHAHMAQEHD